MPELGVRGQDEELELVEREDLPGFLVKRGADIGSSSDQADFAKHTPDSRRSARGSRRPLFRWRPLQQFHNWVERTQINDVPPDEWATVRAQLTEIKEALEKQLAELERLQGNTEADTATEGA